MKYEIRIEGGFTGIPKEMNGEIDLPEQDLKGLRHLLNQDPSPTNFNIRDGQTYHLKLIEGDEVHLASFEETNLPLPIRRFIDTITKNKE